MKTISLYTTILTVLCIGLFSAPITAQNTITIDNNPGSTTTYTTLQDAHDNAMAGDIIYVQPSPTSYGAVQITKSISIIGRSHSEPNKRSQTGNITISASGVTLKGLLISSSLTYSTSNTPNSPPFVGLDVSECRIPTVNIGTTTNQNAATIVAEDVELRGNYTSTITVYYDTDDVTIANNIITDTSNHISAYQVNSLVISNNAFIVSAYFYNIGINNWANFGAMVLFNNMFLFNNFDTSGSYSKVRVRSQANSTVNFTNNLTFNFNASGDSVIFEAVDATTSFQNNNTLANTDPLFNDVDSSDTDSFAGASAYEPSARSADDLTLQGGSPALTGGISNSQIGLYSNGFLYNRLGNPNGFPVVDILSYDGAVPINGNINVQIKAEAK